MTAVLLVAAALLFSSAPPLQTSATTPPAAAQGKVEQELIALDKQFDEARRKGDTAFVADFLTDDFIQVTGTAAVRTKAHLLKALKEQSVQPLPPGAQDAPTPTYTVRMLPGDTAIMTHVIAAPTDTHDPRPGNAVMHVFVKQQGRWKMAAWSSVQTPPTPEHSINRAGYELMESGKRQEAIELFKLNVPLYPESWNVYDSLAEAYAAAGETALAIENYERSIKLNPNNEPGKAALAKLKASKGLSSLTEGN